MALAIALCAQAGLLDRPVFAQPAGNVLVIIADDIGVDMLGIYGGTDVPSTPHIDQLAATGMRFERAWVSPWCSPTRAAIHTGRYGFRTGVGISTAQGPGPVTDLGSERTIPEVLPSGHANAAIGKWHLSPRTDLDGPNQAGYAHFSGTLTNLGGPFFPGSPEPGYFHWKKIINGVQTSPTQDRSHGPSRAR